MRQNIERQDKLEPLRIQTAIMQLSKRGYTVSHIEGAASVSFVHRGKKVTYWPYSGWASGATIQDGRGLKKLLAQLDGAPCQK